MKLRTKVLLIIFITLILLSVALTIAGALFKLQHWPGGSPLLISGLAGNFLGLLTGVFCIISAFADKRQRHLHLSS